MSYFTRFLLLFSIGVVLLVVLSSALLLTGTVQGASPSMGAAPSANALPHVRPCGGC